MTEPLDNPITHPDDPSIENLDADDMPEELSEEQRAELAYMESLPSEVTHDDCCVDEDEEDHD